MQTETINRSSTPSAKPIDPKRSKELETAARETLKRLAPKDNVVPGARYKVSRYDMMIPLSDGTALLFNGRTRALNLLSQPEAQTYSRMGEQGAFTASRITDTMWLRTLVRGGHVVGETIDELALVRTDYEGRRGPSNNLNLTIAPTMGCNFACGYCFQGLDKPTGKMSREVEDAIFTLVKSREGLKSINVVWYGGEPLMGKDSICRISDALIAYCDKKKINYSAGIVSNTFLLTADVARQLYSRRIKWVQVTLDGNRDTHDKSRPLTSGRGTFDTIIENIGAVLDVTPISFNVRVNVGTATIDGASEMLDALAALDFPKRGGFSVYFAPIEASTAESGTAFDVRMGRWEFGKRVLELEAKARRLGLASTIAPPGGFSGLCVAAAAGGYVVTSAGDIHKCWDTAHDPIKRVGTIFEPDSVKDSVALSFWQEWSPFDNPVCTECRIMPMCGGHCAQRYVYSGAEHAAMPCPSWKWNTAEYVFSRAVDLKIVTPDKWLPDQATALTQVSGPVHSQETLKAAQGRILEKVSARHNRAIDRDMLLAGEPALVADQANSGTAQS